MIASIIPIIGDPYKIKGVNHVTTKTNNDSSISLVLVLNEMEEKIINPRELLAIYPDHPWDEIGKPLCWDKEKRYDK